MELREIQLYKLDVLLDIAEVCEKHHLNYFLFWGTLLGAIRHDGFIPWDDDIDLGMLWNDYQAFIEVFPKEKGDKYFVQNYLTDRNFPCPWTQIRVNGTTSMPKNLSALDIHWGICVDIFPVISVSDDDKKMEKQKKAFQLIRSLLVTERMKAANQKAVGAQKLINVIPNRIRHSMVSLLMNRYAYQSPEDAFVCGVGMSDIRRRIRYEDAAQLADHVFEGHMLRIPEAYDAVLKELFGDYMTLPPVEKRGGHEMTQGETIVDPFKDYKVYQKEIKKESR